MLFSISSIDCTQKRSNWTDQRGDTSLQKLTVLSQQFFETFGYKCTSLDPTGACYSSSDAKLPVAHFILTLYASKVQPLRDRRAVFFLGYPVKA
ncbi:hypothetical protein L596_017054 [Steinernema carpocapsae]|uniref:Uncharacterized protein n=1 Tax=Steinernema carpocapsae TaxID=34508 RepID=A0A4V6A1L6_STECR|nr:hypothetical protein L596_017054 [Steinernema carpocapsae]